MSPLTTSLTALSLIVTYVVTAVRNGIDVDDRVPKVYWNVLAWVLGVWIAIAANLDLFSSVSGVHLSKIIGEFVTGIGIGSGGSGWHELLSRLSGTTGPGTPKGFRPRPKHEDHQRAHA